MAEQSKARQRLIDEYIKALQQDQIPWQPGWQMRGPMLPRNASTQKEYTGINRALLMLMQWENHYTDSRWMTFNQARKAGYQIRKGETGVDIETWKVFDTGEYKYMDLADYRKLQKEDPARAKNCRWIVRHARVFNADQIIGIDKVQPEAVCKEKMPEVTEHIRKSLGVEYMEQGQDAYYRPDTDTVVLPPHEIFHSVYDYSATLLHECVHATGHEERLNRDLSGEFGSDSYAREELRAEIGSSFLMQRIGMEPSATHMENHKSYIQAWIRVLQNSPKVLFDAISDAGQIEKYVCDKAQLEKYLQQAGKEAAVCTKSEKQHDTGRER